MALPNDDGFHEIQLNGKQLVFLFMAATVVSVVIFLCGVLVGRGVRAERVASETAALNEAPAPDILPSAAASQASAIQAGADPRVAPPPSPVDEKSNAITEDIRPDAAKAADAARAAAEKPVPTAASTPSPTPTDKTEQIDKASKTERPQKAEKTPEKLAGAPPPAPKPIPEPAATASSKSPSTAPAPAASSQAPAASGDGYAVQVAALNTRTDADAIAKRFSSKGYTAYVETPPNGAGTVFRVRIGTFKTRREAETIAAKLQREEQIKPWVTR